ncbi:ATP-binding cassette domain-containing protein [Amycolatopsis sp. lyj-109]|uniref:ATP-binding cassette domain-containing protein n=1 Tax=Amycolatopsis sp. lyj-109 TaxID=2789287 RepID=UPI0039783A14
MAFTEPPGPGHARTPAELIARPRPRPREAWAGGPSYAQIAERVDRLRTAAGRPPGERTARTTVAGCFKAGRTRPSTDLLPARRRAAPEWRIEWFARRPGKSTLVKLLCRGYDPARGQLLLRDVPHALLRNRISAVFQDHLNHDMTAAENIGPGELSALVSHRLSAVRDAGRIAELGTHESLLAGDGGHARRFHLQADGHQAVS